MCSLPWLHNPHAAEMWKNYLHVGLVKIPSNDEKTLSVSRLQLTDSLVENTHQASIVLALEGTYTAVMETEVNYLGR